MPEISIIVPVYNVKKYLEKCVDSILAQTFKNFEMLLVDDGATDGSGEMCDELAKKDDRIRVIHKVNGGLSDARNKGIDASKGKYIGFVDSDDYIKEDMYETLYKLITENDVEMSCCGVYNCYINSMKPQCPTEETFVTDNKEAYKLLMEGVKIPGGIWNKLFKREVIGDTRFLYRKLYEDVFITMELMPKIKNVAVCTSPKYYYIHREGSITCSPFKSKDMDFVEAYTKNIEVCKKYFPELKTQAEFRYLWAHFFILDKMLVTENYKQIDEYKNVVKFLKQNTSKIIHNPYFAKSRRMSAIALKVNVGIYKQLMLANTKKVAQIEKQ